MSAEAASELEQLKTQTPERAMKQRAPLLPEGELSVTSKAEIPSSDAGTQDAVLSLLSLGQFESKASNKRPREGGEVGPARQRPLRGIKQEPDISHAAGGRGSSVVSSLRGIKPHSNLRGIKPEQDIFSSEEGSGGSPVSGKKGRGGKKTKVVCECTICGQRSGPVPQNNTSSPVHPLACPLFLPHTQSRIYFSSFRATPVQ